MLAMNYPYGTPFVIKNSSLISYPEKLISLSVTVPKFNFLISYPNNVFLSRTQITFSYLVPNNAPYFLLK